MKQQFRAWQSVGDCGKQAPHFGFGEIVQDAFGQDQHLSAASRPHILDPTEIEDRLGKESVPLGFTVEPPPQGNNLRQIEIKPLDTPVV